MADQLRLYNVTIGNHRTLMRLSDSDAEQLHLNAVLASDGPERVTPREEIAGKARTAISNKARGNDNLPTDA